MSSPPAGPILHWVFKTKTGGMEGIITNHQTVFAARAEGMKELAAEQSELTIVPLEGKSVRVVLAMPMPEGAVVTFPTNVVRPSRKKKA